MPALLRAKGHPRPLPCFKKSSPVSSLSFDVALCAQKTTELMAPAIAKDWETVKALAGMPGVDVNGADEEDKTPLWWAAAFNGHIEVVQFLVAQGAKVDAPNKDGCTPMYFTAFNSHIEVVQFLVAQGAKVDAPTKDGSTPLFVAAQNGHIEVVRFLVDAEADLNTAWNGKTPLAVAMQKSHGEVAALLRAAVAKAWDGAGGSSERGRRTSDARLWSVRACGLAQGSGGTVAHSVRWQRLSIINYAVVGRLVKLFGGALAGPLPSLPWLLRSFPQAGAKSKSLLDLHRAASLLAFKDNRSPCTQQPGGTAIFLTGS